MRRRDFVAFFAFAAAAALPSVGRGQPAPRLRLGWVQGVPRSSPQIVAFEARLHELGYIEGKNLTFEIIDVMEHADRYAEAEQELVQRRPDIILAFGPEVALKSALAATRTIPIVMVAIDYDPLALGYVASLAHSGGNVTGLVMQRTEATVKQFQFVKEMFPDLRVATVFWDRESENQWVVAQQVAAELALHLHGVQFHEPPYDYERTFDSVPPDARKALVVLGSARFFIDRAELGEFVVRRRVPSFFVERQNVDAGGLMSYGASVIDLERRAADFVDRIARGDKPSDLPIEQPIKFELVINLRTAQALGLAVPVSLLARADEVIE